MATATVYGKYIEQLKAIIDVALFLTCMDITVVQQEEKKATDNLDILTPLCGLMCVTMFANMYFPACLGCGSEGDILCM